MTDDDRAEIIRRIDAIASRKLHGPASQFMLADLREIFSAAPEPAAPTDREIEQQIAAAVAAERERILGILHKHGWSSRTQNEICSAAKGE